MFIKSDGRRLLQDSPIERARREAAERAKTSPRAKLRERQAQEGQALNSRIKKESDEMAHRHTVARSKERTMGANDESRVGTPAHDAEQRRQKERRDMNDRHRAMRESMNEKHRAELSRLRD